MRRFGCLTPFGIGAGIIAATAVVITALLSGGRMFSPGPLSAQNRAGTTLGGVRNHAELGGSCAACHTSPLDASGMDARCLDCHTDIQAQRAAPDSLHGALPPAQSCRTCHTEHQGATASLTTMALESFPHAALGFALTAHTTSVAGQPFTCADCHTALAQPSPAGGAYTFDQATCVACHTTYQAAFVTSHMADFGNDCLGCHDGIDRYSGFSHNTLRFPLEGKHAGTACRLCHLETRLPTDFTGIATTCIGCHQADDIHQGAYGSDCAGCHTPAAWEQVTFDHNRTAFPLTGAHTSLACTSCHANHIFKGTPTECVACHAEPEIHRGQFGTDCTSCHSTSRWQGATFTHRFPLTHGGQGSIPCATCHTVANDYQRYTCYNCHAHSQTATLAEHREEGITENIDDCVRCHETGH